MSQLRHTEIAAGLAGVLGQEQAAQLVRRVATELELDPEALSDHDVPKLLERLALREGAVGAAARLMLRRQRAQQSKAASSIPPPLAHPVPSNRRKLIEMLAMSIGWDKAESCVETVVRARAIPSGRFTRADALAVLDALAVEQGLIGTVARFAKARVHLEFDP